jgi:hypothetical protein
MRIATHGSTTNVIALCASAIGAFALGLTIKQLGHEGWAYALYGLAAVMVVIAVIWLGGAFRDKPQPPTPDPLINEAQDLHESSVLQGVNTGGAPAQAVTGVSNLTAGRDLTVQLGSHAPPPIAPPEVRLFANGRKGYLKVTNKGPRDRFAVKVHGYYSGGEGEFRAVWNDGTADREIRNEDDAYCLIMALEPVAEHIGLRYYPRHLESEVGQYFERLKGGTEALVSFTNYVQVLIKRGQSYCFKITILRDNGDATTYEGSYSAANLYELTMPSSPEIAAEALKTQRERGRATLTRSRR